MHIGIDWLESVAFEHIKSIGEKVLIIGVGNTAMDCCRTSLRLGAKSVKVMARKPRQFFKASAWELDDAEEENVEIVINRSPKAFVTEGGKLQGMLFDIMEYDFDARAGSPPSASSGEEILPADDIVAGHRPGERLPLDRARPRHRVRQMGRAEDRREDLRVHPAGRVLRRRFRLWSQEHHLGRGARPPGSDLHPQALPGRVRGGAPAGRHEPADLQDGHARVGLQQQLQQLPSVA